MFYILNACPIRSCIYWQSRPQRAEKPAFQKLRRRYFTKMDADNDFLLCVSFFAIKNGFRCLVEGVVPVDDGYNLSCFKKTFQKTQILPVDLRNKEAHSLPANPPFIPRAFRARINLCTVTSPDVLGLFRSLRSVEKRRNLRIASLRRNLDQRFSIRRA